MPIKFQVDTKERISIGVTDLHKFERYQKVNDTINSNLVLDYASFILFYRVLRKRKKHHRFIGFPSNFGSLKMNEFRNF